MAAVSLAALVLLLGFAFLFVMANRTVSTRSTRSAVPRVVALLGCLVSLPAAVSGGYCGMLERRRRKEERKAHRRLHTPATLFDALVSPSEKAGPPRAKL